MPNTMSSKIKVLFALVCFALMLPLASYAASIQNSGGDDSTNSINVYDLLINGAVSAEEATLSGSVAGYPGETFGDERIPLSQKMIMYSVTETVTSVDEDGIEYTTETLLEGDVIVYGLGPICYWDEMGFVRPEIDVDITLKTLKVTYGNGDSKYVVLSVVTNAYILVPGLAVEDAPEELVLRSIADDYYGLPILWVRKNQTSQQEDNQVEPGGDKYNQQ